MSNYIYKIDCLDTELCESVQKIIFQAGYGWDGAGINKDINKYCRYLVVEDLGSAESIGWAGPTEHSVTWFRKLACNQLSIESFIERYGKKRKEAISVGGHVVGFRNGEIKVGCQIISEDKIEKIISYLEQPVVDTSPFIVNVPHPELSRFVQEYAFKHGFERNSIRNTQTPGFLDSQYLLFNVDSSHKMLDITGYVGYTEKDIKRYGTILPIEEALERIKGVESPREAIILNTGNEHYEIEFTDDGIKAGVYEVSKELVNKIYKRFKEQK